MKATQRKTTNQKSTNNKNQKTQSKLNRRRDEANRGWISITGL